MAKEKDNPEKVVHPLYDKGEKKRDPENLAPMRITPAVTISLIVLRIYIILMIALALYRVIQLAISG